MGVIYFPSNFVYWRNIPNHKIFKERIINIIKSDSKKFNSDGKITHNSLEVQRELLNYKEFIDSVVFDTLDEMLNYLNSRKSVLKTNISSSMISQCRCSEYFKDSLISFHDRVNTGRSVYLIDGKKYTSSFTVLYIVNDPNKQNSTTFVQTSKEGVSSHYHQQLFFHTHEKPDILEGTVLIFPSSLNYQSDIIKDSGKVIFSCDILSHFVE